jgi:hypothetical protein
LIGQSQDILRSTSRAAIPQIALRPTSSRPQGNFWETLWKTL